MLLHRNTFPFGKARLKVWQFKGIWPVILSRGPQNFEYFEDLIDLTIAHEQRFLLCHLCENTASWP